MFEAIFSGIVFEYLGLFLRWVTLSIVDIVKGRKPRSFNSLKNKYRRLSADSIAYDFGNRLYGIAFLLAIVLFILKFER